MKIFLPLFLFSLSVALACTFYLCGHEYGEKYTLWKQSIQKLSGTEKVRGNTETWSFYLLCLVMDTFSSFMPCSPEYSAEWVGYILNMCFWRRPRERKQSAFWAGYRKCSLFQVNSEALRINTEKLFSSCWNSHWKQSLKQSWTLNFPLPPHVILFPGW